MACNISNIFDSKKLLLRAYQKKRNEEVKKHEKQWEEQNRWGKKIKEREVGKVNVDTTILSQLNQKVTLSEDLNNLKKLLKQSYKNRRHGDIIRDIELQKQYKPILKPVRELVERSKLNRKLIVPKQLLKPIEPPSKPPLELLEDIEP